MPYCHYQTFREFVRISPLCYKAIDFDGTEYLVPVSQCFWIDRTPCLVTVLVSDLLIKVMTYGTGSLGLNLQEYRRIIYFDKTFDYAFREQSEARIYRMGQQDDCEYFDLTGNVGLELMIDQCIDGKTSLVEHFKKGYRKDQEVSRSRGMEEADRW